MPEGDTIFRTATVLGRALRSKQLIGFDTSVPQVLAMSTRWPVVARIVHEVTPRGKHLLIAFRDSEAGPAADLILHTHMQMIGSWHVYRTGVTWRRPERLAKVVLRAEGVVAPCFNAPVVELLTVRDLARHPILRRLGPDATAEAFDALDARTRLQARPDLSIADGLLLQAAMAGVGNVFKSEILFLERVNPFARIGDLPEEALDRLITQARRLLVLNRKARLRQTRATLDPDGRVWVYQRSGRGCYVCGTPIQQRRQGQDARSTYFCLTCQKVTG